MPANPLSRLTLVTDDAAPAGALQATRVPGNPPSHLTLVTADGTGPEAVVVSRVWQVSADQAARLVCELGRPRTTGRTTIGQLQAAQEATAGTYDIIEAAEDPA